ncbi:MAG: hypothetical protein RI637_09605, partial [Acidimicrobiia bacterium]|nr:hypothetical protein [Acidimicrobiia bacterium]
MRSARIGAVISSPRDAWAICYSAATDQPPRRVSMLKYIGHRMSQMILVPVAFLTAPGIW